MLAFIPNRFQWSHTQLVEANRMLSGIPLEYRRRHNSRSIKKRIYRPGFLRMMLTDPSEAVASEQILPELHKAFTTVEETPLGGNLLQLVLKDIAHHFVTQSEETDALLQRLFEEEDRFLEHHPSDFIFGVYAKK